MTTERLKVVRGQKRDGKINAYIHKRIFIQEKIFVIEFFSFILLEKKVIKRPLKQRAAFGKRITRVTQKFYLVRQTERLELLVIANVLLLL